MAKDKKSFVLYCDQRHIFNELSNEEAGMLIKHIFSYTADENPEPESRLIKIAFEPIKHQLKRDLIKYETVRERNSNNAKKRWNAKNATACDRIPNDAKNADNDNDNDNDNVTGSIGSAAPDFSGETLNAEETILANRIRFEQIMVKIGASEPVARQALRKYHLHLEEQDQYPKSKKAVFAGFEKWLMNEANFTWQPVADTGGRRMVY